MITPLPSYEAIDPALSNEIHEDIEYLCSFHDCEDIRTIFVHELAPATQDHLKAWEKSELFYQDCIETSTMYCVRETYSKNLDRWAVTSLVDKAIRVHGLSYTDTQTPPIFSFSLQKDENSVFPIDTRGYDMIVLLSSL